MSWLFVLAPTQHLNVCQNHSSFNLFIFSFLKMPCFKKRSFTKSVPIYKVRLNVLNLWRHPWTIQRLHIFRMLWLQRDWIKGFSLRVIGREGGYKTKVKSHCQTELWLRHHDKTKPQTVLFEDMSNIANVAWLYSNSIDFNVK